MIVLKHKANYKTHEQWHMEVTEPGTRKLGPPVVIDEPHKDYFFHGRPIIDVGKIVHEDGGENMIVTDGLEIIGSMLIDRAAQWDTGLTYQAEGTDNTAPAAGQTDLVAETARKIMTSRSLAGVATTYSTFFTGAEANDNIAEAGIFGTSTASAAADSGIMFARWLAAFDNSLGTYDITFTYILTPAYA